MQKKILIADDHYVVRMGTSLLLHSTYEGLEIDFAEHYENVKTKVSVTLYDLIILDIDMPGSLYLSMIKELKELSPDSKILIFSAYDEKTAVQYIHEGADGYLNKQQSEKVVDAVTLIFREGNYYPQEVLYLLVNKQKEPVSIYNLSKRELQVFQLLAEGNGNLEISNILNLKMSTVSTFKRRIFEKLHIKTIVDIIKLYEKHRTTIEKIIQSSHDVA
ncbi:response regulator transcription factor [Chryseobacterium sp. PMSZPI]|uniref:response regulator transcription factor n=1 Tax=Chryseobacterium sp. PMSZPI TaxID=1033900 RepID=UPI000C32E793|nr:response regulator transcription factor [Chryseobacterium sp. PMSZPI]PKF73616.1 DNA-binding response regulator [Chryseobacterium sp. PMSZPI]